MIEMISIWNRVRDYAKKQQSGLDTVPDFNGKVNEAQLELVNAGSPFLETNDRVKGLFDPLMAKMTGVSSSEGILPKPPNYFKTLSFTVTSGGNRFPAMPAQVNEIELLYLLPQRKPDPGKKRAYFITNSNSITLHPLMTLTYSLDYLKYPAEGKLVFDRAFDEESGEIVQTLNTETTVNLDWGMDAFNILVYMVLEKYGISSREPLLQEFARLGIKDSLAYPATDVQKR